MDTANAAQKEHRLKKYQWPKGVSGNPLGKEKGTLSPKATIRQMFKENPERFNEWLEEYIEDPNNRRHVVELLDGKPPLSVAMEVSIPQTLIDLIRGTADPTGDNKVSGENTE